MMTRKEMKKKIADQELQIKNKEERIIKLETTLVSIKALASMNKYNYPEVFLRKINELARRVNQNQFKKFYYSKRFN